MEELLKDFVGRHDEISISSDWDKFISSGLPARKDEEYKFTPLTKALEKHIDWESLSNAEGSAESTSPLLSSQTEIVFLNGKLRSDLSKWADDISVEINKSSDDRFSSPWDDPFYLLNKAVASDSITITISKGITVNEPIYIRHISDTSQGEVVSFAKLFVFAEENCEATVVEHFQGNDINNSADFSVAEYQVKKSARVRSYKLQLEGSKHIHAGNIIADQERDSNFENFVFSMKGKMVRNNLLINQNEEHCESHLNGLYMINASTHIDNHTTVDHKKANSYSNELYKGILDENSTGVFNGKIYVRPNAQNTNAFQSNNNLLLSDTATLHTKPQLEIWADDVKCSHGCTSGQLDKEAMFYLKTRGLSQQQAKAIMLKAYVSEVVEKIKVEEIKSEVTEKVDGLLF